MKYKKLIPSKNIIQRHTELKLFAIGVCEECGNRKFDNFLTVVNSGDKVCKECLENYTECTECGEYFITNDMTDVGGSNEYVYVCEECLNDNYKQCKECDQYHLKDDMTQIDRHTFVCNDCYGDNYFTCYHCEDITHVDDKKKDHNENCYCSHCFSNNTFKCEECGNVYNDDQGNSDSYNTVICNSCHESIVRCSDCGCWCNGNNGRNQIDWEDYCDKCYPKHKGKIHNYSYKPEPIFHRNTKNELDLFGVELEIDNGGDDKENASKLLDIMNDNDEDHIYIKNDASIDDGFEIVSHPATLEKHLKEFKWQELMEEAIDLNYKSHDCETCGLHIHINKEAFGISEDKQDLNILKLLLVVEMHWNKFVKFSRRTEKQLEYCDRYGFNILNNTQDDAKELLEVAKDSDTSRFHAINLKPFNTVEIRIFRGTLKYETYVATLQFCQTLLDIIRNTDIQHIQALTWKSIINYANDFNYQELLAYLQKRKLA